TLAVSVKRNPGMTTHAQCDAHGYRNLRPSRAAPVPALRPGEWHRLRASLAGEALSVSLDGIVVWEGGIGPEGTSFAGPGGVRSGKPGLGGGVVPAAAGGGRGRPGAPVPGRVKRAGESGPGMAQRAPSRGTSDKKKPAVPAKPIRSDPRQTIRLCVSAA